MLRLCLRWSRSTVSRSPKLFTPTQTRSFHESTFRATEDLNTVYTDLLAEISAESSVKKRRSRKKEDGGSQEAPKRRVRASTASKSKSKVDEPLDSTEGLEDATVKPKRRRKSTKTLTAAAEGSEGGPTKPKRRSRVEKTPPTAEELKARKEKRIQRAQLQSIRNARIPVSLLDDPWTDVTKYLKASYGSHQSLGDTRRAHVISESLCDDALARLEPTLEKHVGCDIIDINPGVCLWSTKLHQRLKPRKHILLEPDQKLYSPFLLPLSNAPDSTYEIIPKSGIIWSHLETILTRHSLPHQQRLEKGDPKLEEPNNTLLVIANLGYYPMKPYRGFHSLASLVLYQFMTATRVHSLFQRYGKVRFMVWTNDDERRHLLPREVHLRRKSAVEAEITFEKLHEVVSSTSDYGPYQRDESYNLAKVQEVQEMMKAANITTPEGRESLLAEKLLKPMEESKDEDGHKRTWGLGQEVTDELNSLESAFKAGEIPEKIQQEGKKTPNPSFLRMRKLQVHRDFVLRRLDLYANLIQQHDDLVQLQREIYTTRAAGGDTTELEGRLQQEKEQWQDETEKLPEHYQKKLFYLLDNHRTASYDPPLLMYDRREFEPLRVQPTEFYPPQPMCLLDFQPRSAWPVLRDGENSDILEFIVGTMFHLPTQSVKRALKSLWPGAYEWIVKECPSLSNPEKGGALDLDMLTVRSLSESMLEEIVTAWSTWPFKPKKHELLGRMGATSYDPDEVEVN